MPHLTLKSQFDAKIEIKKSESLFSGTDFYLKTATST